MIKLFKLFILFITIFSYSSLYGSWRFNKLSNDTLEVSEQARYNYYFTEATKQKIFGNYNEAINLFFKCIKLNPGSAAVRYQLSDIYYITGEKKKALSYARVAYKLDKNNVWYLLNLARMYQFNDKIDSTIFIYKRIIKFYPNKYEYKFNLALLYAKVNEYKKSTKLLIRLERQYGLSKDIIFSFYKVYTLQNDNKNAIKILKDGLKKYPNEYRLYGLLAEHYASMNENALAFQYYNELLNLDTDNESGMLSMFEFYKCIGKFDEAIELLKRLNRNENISEEDKVEVLTSVLKDIKVFNGHQDNIKSLIEELMIFYKDDILLHSLYADFFVKTNNLEKAKDELILVTEKVKNNYTVWERLFYVLSSLNEYKVISSLTDEALLYFKEKPLFYLFKGIAAFQLKDYRNSLEYLNDGYKFIGNEKALELQFYTFLGEVYNALKDYKNSDLYFEKALNIDKQNIYVLNNYSYYLALRRENLDIAEEYIKRCLEFEPKNYNYLDTYAWILFNSQRLNEARETIEKAIANGGSSSSNILEHYAEILVKLKLNGEALNCYKKIKEMGRDSSSVKILLNIVE
jgi:tetratricopeptide (TPR) repeat protein